jgi:inhibitor of cysteine peptidase
LTQRAKLFFIGASAAVAFCGAALSGGGVDLARAQSPTTSKGSDVVTRIGNADNGGKKELRVGDQFEVALPENPTTGYRWQLHTPVGPVLEVEDDSFVGSAPGLIGAGGLRSWRFRALKAGLAHLTIDNRRSWEPAPIGTFEVTIEVTAQ